MKLLFDQNLSASLSRLLADLFPQSAHVKQFQMETASDFEVWQFAKSNGFMIVSKDSDFCALSLTYGFPPKVIFLRIGNKSVADTEKVLRINHDVISEFSANHEETLLILTSLYS